MATLGIINTTTNICENVTLDDQPIDQIVLPSPYIAIDLSATPTLDWKWDTDSNQWILVNGSSGGIGFTWDGTHLIAPQPANPPNP